MAKKFVVTGELRYIAVQGTAQPSDRPVVATAVQVPQRQPEDLLLVFGLVWIDLIELTNESRNNDKAQSDGNRPQPAVDCYVWFFRLERKRMAALRR